MCWPVLNNTTECWKLEHQINWSWIRRRKEGNKEHQSWNNHLISLRLIENWEKDTNSKTCRINFTSVKKRKLIEKHLSRMQHLFKSTHSCCNTFGLKERKHRLENNVSSDPRDSSRSKHSFQNIKKRKSTNRKTSHQLRSRANFSHRLLFQPNYIKDQHKGFKTIK